MSERKQTGRAIGRLLLLSSVAGAAAASGAYAYAWGIEPNWIELKKVELTLPHLPQEFDRYRITQISDIHAGKWMPNARIERIVEIVNRQQADLIAVTGDFVTQTYEKAPVDIVPAMKKLRARDGVVAILGNHDYWGELGPYLIKRVIKESDMIDLNNDVHTLDRDGKHFHIGGVDSFRAAADRLDYVIAKLSRKGAAMLLAHEPDFADAAARSKRFDLQISGHSHGGQIVIPFMGPPHLPPLGEKYHTGLYKVGDMLQYTNRGLGVVGLPVRFWCRPEITVFTLRAGNSNQAG
jgi:predicted MPP superfamily phosphohydrolase